jgi:hypothetical protein
MTKMRIQQIKQCGALVALGLLVLSMACQSADQSGAASGDKMSSTDSKAQQKSFQQQYANRPAAR